MKLWYIYIGGNDPGSSVQRKVVCQIQALRENGIDAEGVLFSALVDQDFQLSSEIRVIKVPAYVSDRKYFRNFYEMENTYEFIHSYLRNHGSEFDSIFLRHGFSCDSYFEIIKDFGSRMYLYIPSNTIAENFRERQVAENNGIVGLAFRWWEYFRYFYIHETKLIRTYLKKLKGVVVFTNEFASILRRRSGNKVNYIYNRDGADCMTVIPRKKNAERSGKVKLLFMKGSSMAQPWSGIDRLINSISATGDDRFELYITGRVVNEEWKKHDFVHLTGRLSAVELRTLTDKVDLGVSNLANYLIGFNETTNLKSREYFACGLPFIQANSMPDIDGTSAENYYLRLPNDGSLIDMNLVYDFAMSMRENANHIEDMREFAEYHLDWKETVAELAEHLT
jgi:hypothetical protein